MKLSQNTEWVILGALIVYIAFVPPIPAVRQFLSTAFGKLVGLAAIVYVWKSVSQIVAVLLLVAMIRCISSARVETFTGAEKECTCKNPEQYKWDSVTKKCRDSSGAEGEVESCACDNGYAWDGGEKGRKECIPTSGNEPPIPPVVPTEANMMPPTESIPAPAEKPTAAPTVPMTTPGAAQEAVATSTPSAVTGPIPSTAVTTTGAAV